MEGFPVKDIIEQSVGNTVNALVGNNDVNLNTIVKMSMLDDIKPLDDEKKKTIITAIYENNKLEDYFIKQEYQLTYDNSGNVVYINEEKDKDSA